MSPAPLVSVLITTYNRSNLLRRAINSVLMQNFGDCEIVVIDDCSTDNTRAVVASFDDARIRYIRNETNIGSKYGDRAMLRTFVYETMRGRYFVYLCDDDYWLLPNLLRRQIGTFHAHSDLVMAIGGQLSYFLTTPESYFGWPPEEPLTLTMDNIGQYFDLATMTSKTPHINYMRMGNNPLFPKSLMSSEEFLHLRAENPAGRNLIGGATLYSRERFIQSGALKSPHGSQWQAGYELMMGPACYGSVAYFDEPCIVTEIRGSNASFRGTQVDHYHDSIKSVEAAFKTPLRDPALMAQRTSLKAIRNETIRNLSRAFLGNTLAIRQSGKLTLCSEENIKRPVTFREVIPVLWRERILPRWDDLTLLLQVERPKQRLRSFLNASLGIGQP